MYITSFESFPTPVVDLFEDDIKLVLVEYISSFITHELGPGIYTFKVLSEALLMILQTECAGHHDAIVIEFDDITIKTKLVVRPEIIAIRSE